MAKLFVNYGAMGSSKTANLLITQFNYLERGLNPLVLTSSIDDRSGVGIVASRISGLKTEAIPIRTQDDIYKLIEQENNIKKVDVVLVDEAQFLTKEHVDQLTDVVDILGISTITYCLRTDFQGNFFEGSKWLFAWADEIHEIKTMCDCDHKANFNARIVDGKIVKTGNQIQIGGNESYIALCRKHWKIGRLK